MDPCLWGPLLWSVLEEGARTVEPGYAPGLMTEKERADYTRVFILFVYSLRYVLFCSQCRCNFRQHIREHPPEKATSLLEWVWATKNSVLDKNKVPRSLPFEDLRKRALLWTEFAPPSTVWDICTIFSARYPRKERVGPLDEDKEAKRSAYFIFFHSLSTMCQRVAAWNAMAPLLLPPGDERVFGDRKEFMAWVEGGRQKWMEESGKSEAEKTAWNFAMHNIVASSTKEKKAVSQGNFLSRENKTP